MESKMAHSFDVDKYKEIHLVKIILTVPKKTQIS